MATEKTEPRIGLITGIAVFTIVTIVLLRFFLISYFSQMFDEEAHRKIGGLAPHQLVTQRAHERELLENGAVPITQAMQLMSQGGRPAAIAPQPSTDFQPLQGWSMRPTGWHAPPPPTIAPGPTVQPGGPMMQGGPSGDGTTAPAPGAQNPAPAPTGAVAPAGNAAPAAATAAPAHTAAPATAAPAHAAPAAAPAHAAPATGGNAPPAQ